MSYVIVAGIVFLLAFTFGYLLGQVDAKAQIVKMARTSGGVTMSNVRSGGSVTAVVNVRSSVE